MEIEAKLKESEAIPLYHEKQRLKSELDNLQAHAHWLEGELEAKGKDYQRLLQESRDRHMQLQMHLQHTENEKVAATTKNAELNELQTRLHAEVEKLTADLKKKSQEAIHLRETTDIEVQQERQYIQLQQDQLTRWESRYNDVVRENQSLKAAAAQAIEATENDVERIKKEVKEEYEKLLREQAAEYESRLAQQPLTVAALPASDQIDDDDDEDAPVGLTEVFSRLEQTKGQLREMKHRAETAERTTQRLLADIQNKTPMMLRQREEYELAMDQIEDIHRRLEKAIADKESAQAELEHTRKELAQTDRRYTEQVAETKTLAQQVQALLTSRATGGSSGQNFPTSVAEMQQQNQRLLSDNRKLQKEVADLEQKLQTDELRAKVNALEQECEELASEREKQEDLVLKITKERDIYRYLNGTQGSDGRQLTVEEVSRQQIEKTKELEARVRTLNTTVATLTAEKDQLVREKEGIEERLVRSETNRKDLMESNSKLQTDVYKTKGDLARHQSDATYYKEKLTRVEELLRRSSNEVTVLGNARIELQRINAELQHSLSKEKDLVSQANSVREQAETKLRRAQADVEAAKAGERRANEDNSELRREIARQGSIIESVRRIESSLSARSTTETESLKEEKEHLKQQLVNDRKKLEAEIENLKERVRETEARIVEAGNIKSKAEAEMLEAKKSLLASETEKRSLALKFENLEAKLRAANKKLGITEDSDQADVSLQARVDELSAEVEKGKAEITSLQKSVETYKKIAKDGEKSYNDLSTAAEELKKKQSKELADKSLELESVRSESAKRQEMIVELTNDLSKQREEAQQAESKLKAEISMTQAQMESFEKDAESSKAAAAAAALDLETLQNELASTQDNYERELKLHSQARSSLRGLREQLEEAVHQGQASEEKIASLNQSLILEQEKVQKTHDEMLEATKLLEERLEASKSQNKVLHSQLESLNDMVAKLQSDRVAAASEEDVSVSDTDIQALRKQLAEVREVVKYLRSENDMIQTQLDTAKRTIDREKAAGNVLKSSLEEVRAELASLKEATGNSDSTVAKELAETKSKLVEEENQLRLLRDSNKVLRESSENSDLLLTEAKYEIAKLKEAAKPLEKASHDATVRIAQLEAEKESLNREVAAWKSRVESLVSKFNQIDPEEHRKALKRVEELEEEKDALSKWKTTMEKENTRIREIARRLKQSQTENAGVVESQKKEIEKLKEEKTSLSKASSASSDLAKERDALKEKMTKLEKDAASQKTELQGANTMNERLRERLRQFQNTIRELKAREQAAPPKVVAAAPSPPPNKDETAQEKTAPQSQTGSAKTQPTALEQASKTTASSKQPQVPQGGFKYGPSTSEDGKGEKGTGSSLRGVAPAFTPQSVAGKQESVAVSKQEAASTKTPEVKSESPAPSIQSKAQTQSPAPDSSTTNEKSYKERLLEKKNLLEKKRKLAEKMKKLMESKAKSESGEEKPSKKARVADLSIAAEPIPAKADTGPKKEPTEARTSTEKDTDTQVDNSRSLVPIEEGAVAEEDTAAEGNESEAPEVGQDRKEETTSSGADNPFAAKGVTISSQANNPFAAALSGAAGNPFGTTSSFSGAPTSTFGQASSFGGSSAFGSGATPSGTAGMGFGSAATSGAPAPTSAFGVGTPPVGGGPAASAFGGGTPPAGGTLAATAFGSAFLNMKPPGNATPPTFSFGSSTTPIVLPTPTLTAPAPSPFGAFAGSTFGSGASFGPGAPFGSPNTQPFGSRPLFGGMQQDQSKEDEKPKEGDKDEETKNP
eukprot:scaffold108_cov162-Amphora_coffeaeformis.AAC.30